MNTIILAAIGALVGCGVFCLIVYQHRKIKRLKRSEKDLEARLNIKIEINKSYYERMALYRSKIGTRGRLLKRIRSQIARDLECFDKELVEAGIKIVRKKRSK